MDLHIYLSLPAHLCSGYLLESFQLFPKYLLKRHYLTYLSLLAAMIVALLIQMPGQ